MHRYLFTIAFLVLLSLLVVGCGDTEETEPPDRFEGMDCPRFEMDSFDDCTFEKDDGDDDVEMSSDEDVEQFCQSSCDKLGHISVRNADDITDMRLYLGVKEAYGIHIDSADNFEDFEGLENLESLEGGVYIEDVPALTSLKGLDSLETVGNTFTLHGSGSDIPLKTLEGLESLREVEHNSFQVYRLDELRSVDELESLEKVDGELQITNNPKLPNCQAEAIADRVEADNVQIHGNGSGTCE